MIGTNFFIYFCAGTYRLINNWNQAKEKVNINHQTLHLKTITTEYKVVLQREIRNFRKDRKTHTRASKKYTARTNLLQGIGTKNIWVQYMMGSDGLTDGLLGSTDPEANTHHLQERKDSRYEFV